MTALEWRSRWARISASATGRVMGAPASSTRTAGTPSSGGAELGGLVEGAHDGPGMAVEMGEDFGVGDGAGDGRAGFVDQDGRDAELRRRRTRRSGRGGA